MRVQRKRIAALLLSAAMMLQAGGVTALAAEGGLPTGAGGVEACTHHTHDDACGYTTAVPGAACTHVHDESYGFVEAVEGIPCDKGCADGGHVAGCSHTPAIEGVPCVHQHDESCGRQLVRRGQGVDPCLHLLHGGWGPAPARRCRRFHPPLLRRTPGSRY